MRWVTYILTFLLSRYSLVHTKTRSVVEVILSQTRKVAVSLCVIWVSSLLFVGGFLVTLVAASNIYEVRGDIYPAPVLITGGVTSLVGLTILFMAFWKGNWELSAELVTPSPGPSIEKTDVSPLEEALSLLIRDFVREREMERAQRPPEPAAPKPSVVREYANTAANA